MAGSRSFHADHNANKNVRDTGFANTQLTMQCILHIALPLIIDDLQLLTVSGCVGTPRGLYHEHPLPFASKPWHHPWLYWSTWYGLSCLAWLARMSRSSLHRKGCFGLRRVFMWLKNVPTKTCPRTSTSRSLSLKQCCSVKVIFVQPDMVATCSEIAANMTEAGFVGCKFGSVHMWKKPLRPTKYLSPEPTQSD